MKASEYGIRNLKRIIAQLPEWTKEDADKYENLETMYGALVGQFSRYMGHVVKNVGGIYETPKSVEQNGDVYEPAPKEIQQDAVVFLNKQLFETPTWLLDEKILNKISDPVSSELVANVQTNILNSLLSPARLNRMATSTNRFGTKNTYALDQMMDDLKKGVWNELSSHKPIDGFRRNLQKAYVEALVNIVNPSPGGNTATSFVFPGITNVNTKNTDVVSVSRAQLTELKAQITAAIPATQDKMSKYHLQDVSDRIKKALDPKG
jgi:hypothetical protein